MPDAIIQERLELILEHTVIEPGFIKKNLSLNPDNINRFRDLISHHYEILDYQVIFNICSQDIPKLDKIIRAYLKSLLK